MREGSLSRPLGWFLVVVVEAEEEVRVLDVGVEGIGVELDHLGVVRRVRRLRLAEARLAEVFSVWACSGSLHAAQDRPRPVPVKGRTLTGHRATVRAVEQPRWEPAPITQAPCSAAP